MKKLISHLSCFVHHPTSYYLLLKNGFPFFSSFAILIEIDNRFHLNCNLKVLQSDSYFLTLFFDVSVLIPISEVPVTVW